MNNYDFNDLPTAAISLTPRDFTIDVLNEYDNVTIINTIKITTCMSYKFYFDIIID